MRTEQHIEAYTKDAAESLAAFYRNPVKGIHAQAILTGQWFPGKQSNCPVWAVRIVRNIPQ